jgi:predicted metal-dependent phosphoesterase TrpH
MKKLYLFVLSILCMCGLHAQDSDIQYQMMKGYKKGFIPQKICIPDILGYKTLKCDLHLHTTHSDGRVTPSMRVQEAWREGLDAIAITDHQPWPRFDGSTDGNLSYFHASHENARYHITLIKGLELTSSGKNFPSIGHLNILFVKDCNAYFPKDRNFDEHVTDSLLNTATAEGAFVTANHPGWPDRNSELSPFLIKEIKDKKIQGVEIFNDNEFYPRAIDYISDYNLTPIGATDCHYPTSFLWDLSKTHRDMTLVFAKDTTTASIKEALFARRTVAYANNLLAGKAVYLKALFQASLRLESFTIDGKYFHARVYNESDISYLLDNGDPSRRIRIPAHQICDMVRGVESLKDIFEITNMYVGPTKKLAVPMSAVFVSKDKSIKIPYAE